MHDEHYEARSMIETHTLADGTPLKLSAIAPRFERTPGGTRWIGPELGSHNEEVYSELLGMGADELASLRKDGVI